MAAWCAAFREPLEAENGQFAPTTFKRRASPRGCMLCICMLVVGAARTKAAPLPSRAPVTGEELTYSYEQRFWLDFVINKRAAEVGRMPPFPRPLACDSARRGVLRAHRRQTVHGGVTAVFQLPTRPAANGSTVRDCNPLAAALLGVHVALQVEAQGEQERRGMERELMECKARLGWLGQVCGGSWAISDTGSGAERWMFGGGCAGAGLHGRGLGLQEAPRQGGRRLHAKEACITWCAPPSGYARTACLASYIINWLADFRLLVCSPSLGRAAAAASPPCPSQHTAWALGCSMSGSRPRS